MNRISSIAGGSKPIDPRQVHLRLDSMVAHHLVEQGEDGGEVDA